MPHRPHHQPFRLLPSLPVLTSLGELRAENVSGQCHVFTAIAHGSPCEALWKSAWLFYSAWGYTTFALFQSWALYFCLQSLKLVEFSLSVGPEVMLVLSSFLPDLPQDSHFSLQNPWLLVYSWRFPESFVLFCA